jgi:hypothetical protein
MERRLSYNGKEMCHVNQKDELIFTNGPDLNEYLDEVIGGISEVEDDYGNVIFERKIASTDLKILHLVEVMGFKIK